MCMLYFTSWQIVVFSYFRCCSLYWTVVWEIFLNDSNQEVDKVLWIKSSSGLDQTSWPCSTKSIHIVVSFCEAYRFICVTGKTISLIWHVNGLVRLLRWRGNVQCSGKMNLEDMQQRKFRAERQYCPKSIPRRASSFKKQKQKDTCTEIKNTACQSEILLKV